ncbi:MAG TPA: S41 family peptidase [Gemmatimonadales bacterium]
MNRRVRTAAVAAAALVPLVAGGFILQEREVRDGGRLFEQVMGLVSTRFVDTVGVGSLYEKAARGLVEQLEDPYSELYTPEQLAQFTQNTGGRYGGLGMQIEEVVGRGVSVMKVFPNTPAERAGVQAGDIIVGIDTANARGFKSAEVSDRLKGEPGTSVLVTFARPAVPQPIKVEMERAIIHIPAVPYTLAFGNVGYLRLEGFNETAGEEFDKALQELRAGGAKGLVVDLRDNPGGYLEHAIGISNMFLQPGQEILSVRGRGQPNQTYVARGRPAAPDLPLVILINGRSASASEIVAGALQDHDRALIIGETSFGKGLVQSLFNLDGGWAVKLTTAKWFTPVGRSIQKERKLLPDGRFVEIYPDSLPADSLKKIRPTYKSDAGRTVYGGGAITPDLTVMPDTFSAAEQELARAVAPKGPEFFSVIAQYAYDLKGKVQPGFTIQPEWREELRRRLEAAGITVPRETWEKGVGYADHWLAQRIADTSFGQAEARRRLLESDPQFQKALEVLRKGNSQKDLFALALAQH